MTTVIEAARPEVQFAERGISTLRQIRGSLFEWIARPKPTVAVTTAIADAEKIGAGLGAYLINPRGKNSDMQMEQTLNEELAQLQKKYQRYREYGCTPSSGKRSLKDTLPTRLGYLWYVASYQIGKIDEFELRTLMGFDNRKQMPTLNIFNNRLGVVAPLSGDYFHALLVKRAIEEYTSLPAFQLKPIILNAGLDLDSNQGIGQRDEEFSASVDEIAVWTDIDATRKTRYAASKAVELLYPEKPKHGTVPEGAIIW